MNREEAIDIIRKNIPHLGIGATEMTEALNELIPELRESEDERIRRSIVDFIKLHTDEFEYSTDCWDILAWLEKQKGLFESGKGMYYYDGEKTTYCGYPAMEENPYDFAMNQQEKQKEQKPNIEICPHSIKSKSYKENGYPIESEQKPTDLPAGFYYIDLNGNRYYSKEFRYGDMKLKVGEQKSAELSEEDKDRIEHIVGSLESLKKYTRENIGMSEEYKEHIFRRLEQEQSWLKSLRPNKQD